MSGPGTPHGMFPSAWEGYLNFEWFLGPTSHIPKSSCAWRLRRRRNFWYMECGMWTAECSRTATCCTMFGRRGEYYAFTFTRPSRCLQASISHKIPSEYWMIHQWSVPRWVQPSGSGEALQKLAPRIVCRIRWWWLHQTYVAEILIWGASNTIYLSVK